MVSEYNIRYVKLHFILKMLDDTELPVHKTSAIRGGIGEMLLRLNCIQDRKCEICDFTEECIVQRTMYSKFDTNKPEFVTKGDSVGYVVECNDYKQFFAENDELRFNLILFGKNIVYFNQYLQAIYALGQSGIGKEYSKFIVAEVLNTVNKPILHGRDIYMKNYQVNTIEQYINYRLRQLNYAGERLDIELLSPMSLKYQGQILNKINMDALLKAIWRRVYILNCFENNEASPSEEYSEPNIISQEVTKEGIRRYSFRKEEAMVLYGIRGRITIEEADEKVLRCLIAGEILHVGKNTSFGFGQYRLNKHVGGYYE